MTKKQTTNKITVEVNIEINRFDDEGDPMDTWSEDFTYDEDLSVIEEASKLFENEQWIESHEFMFKSENFLSALIKNIPFPENEPKQRFCSINYTSYFEIDNGSTGLEFTDYLGSERDKDLYFIKNS